LAEGRDGGWQGAARAFPWDAVLHVGLCLLRLSPRDLWALTPVEFFTMAGGAKPRGAAIGRDGLDALMRAFPDG
jgi:uncharacterized phage protein (TIGR02216 family)